MSAPVDGPNARPESVEAPHKWSMVRRLFSRTGTSKVRQALDCASPLALWVRTVPKRQRTAAVQDAVATTNTPARLAQRTGPAGA